jgi:DNA-binding beta-propeller fold protein YncE
MALPESGPARENPRHRAIKALILLIIAAGLIWVLFLAVQYFLNRQQIAQLPAMPGVGAIIERPPEYLTAFRDVDRPIGIIAADGRLYVAESSGDRMVRVLNNSGLEMASLAPPQTDSATRLPLYLALSPDGVIYVSDRFNRVIHMFGPEGDHMGVFKPPPEAAGWHPMGIALDQHGSLYVTDVSPGNHRVLVFDRLGELRLQFGTEGTEPGRFLYPNGIAVDDRGRVYVADGNNGRLQAFDSSGRLLFIIPRGYASGDLAMPRGVAVNEEYRLFVADAAAHTVKVYDVSGDEPRFLRGIGGHGIGEGQLRFPMGIALDADTVYIADRENGRIHMWRY